MIDSLARFLPTKRILEPCMRYINEYIQSSDPLKRKAAFGALTVLARGCCDVLAEYAEQLVPYVFLFTLMSILYTYSLFASLVLFFLFENVLFDSYVGYFVGSYIKDSLILTSKCVESLVSLWVNLQVSFSLIHSLIASHTCTLSTLNIRPHFFDS